MLGEEATFAIRLADQKSKWVVDSRRKKRSRGRITEWMGWAKSCELYKGKRIG